MDIVDEYLEGKGFVQAFTDWIAKALNLETLGLPTLTLIIEFAFAIALLVAFALLLFWLKRRLEKLSARITASNWLDRQKLRVQREELISNDLLKKIISSILLTVKWLTLLVFGFLSLDVILGLFPQTQTIANYLFSLFSDTVSTAFFSVIGYIPNLLMIIVALVITRFFIRIMEIFFNGIKNRRIKLDAFYPEWADTTLSLLKMLTYLIGFVIIFPYLPGSHSEAFKGLSIFVGIIISLGSTTAVANVVAGVVLTYTRAFTVGDYILVDNVKGEVLGRSMFVTQIKSYKNELISVPNAKMLSGHIINYSMQAGRTNLILHTEVSLGYDVPWKTAEELLLKAAHGTTGLEKRPHPYVLHKSLNDFYVSYELNATTKKPESIPRIYSRLHKNIQEVFGKAGIEIMSPHYRNVRDVTPAKPPLDEAPIEGAKD